MKTLKPLRLGVLTRTFEDGPKCYLSVALLAFVPFDEPSRLLPEVSLWKLAVPLLAPQGVLDECMPKAQAEVLVYGNAYPKGGPAPSTYVRLLLGNIDKTLYVFGDRRWKLGVQTNPEPFAEMPIRWEYAFGGAGFVQNQAGKGIGTIRTPAGEIHPLPNIESPAHLIKSPQDKPEPVGLGALDIMSPVRQQHVGTYDDVWLKTRYPGYPEDFHWAFFNVAPEDQRVAGFFKGGESFAVHNMHPDEPVVEGRIPEYIGRAFVQFQEDKPETLHEVKTKIDTLILFPNQKRVAILYRGVIEVQEDDAHDVRYLLCACEHPSAPKPVEHYQRALAERLDPDKQLAAMMRDRDLLPDLPKADPSRRSEDDKLGDMEDLMQMEHLVARNMHNGVVRRVEWMREEAARRGIDPARIPPAPPPPKPASVAPDDVADTIEEALQEADKARKQADATRADVERRMRAECAKRGIDYDEMLERGKRSRPQRLKAKRVIEQLEGLRDVGDRGGVDLPVVRAKLADPKLTAKLIEMETQMHEVYRRFGHMFPPGDAEALASLREEVANGVREGKTFAGRELDGVDLSGLDLSGGDFEGAFLEGADLRNTKLVKTNFRNAILARADLEGATFQGTILSGANLGSASLRGVDLSGIELDRAVLVKADLRGAKLVGVLLDDADLSETTFEDCDFSQAKARNGFVLNTTLRRVKLRGADLTKLFFVDAVFDEVDFEGATLVSTILAGVRGERCSFRHARLDNARFIKDASFPKADFQNASLVGTNFRGANLEGAIFTEVNAETADFSSCDLRHAQMGKMRAHGARFVRTDLRDADLSNTDLIESILQKARVDRTNFTGANLFRADLAKVRGDKQTSLSRAFVKRVRFIEAKRSS